MHSCFVIGEDILLNIVQVLQMKETIKRLKIVNILKYFDTFVINVDINYIPCVKCNFVSNERKWHLLQRYRVCW